MKLIADIQGDILAMMKQELVAAERAVTAGVSEAASGLQTAWRGRSPVRRWAKASPIRFAGSFTRRPAPRSGRRL